MNHRLFLFLLLAIFAPGLGRTQSVSTVAFTLPERDLIPEGIAHDPVTKSFFVSSTFRRKIVRIDSNGVATDFVAQGRDGLWGVVGMKVDPVRRMLWAASSHAGMNMPMIDMDSTEEGRSGVFKYDLGTGRLLRKYVLDHEPEPHFLNDLVVNRAGEVFITDSRERAIYHIDPMSDSLEVYLKPPGMASPNGIALSNDEKYLYVTLRGAIGRIEMATRDFILLIRPAGVEAPGDGLYFYQNSLITVWPDPSGGWVMRYPLNENLDAITEARLVDKAHSAMEQPTTGVIVGNRLYYIANSQLQAFRRLFQPHGSYATDSLREPVVLWVEL